MTAIAASAVGDGGCSSSDRARPRSIDDDDSSAPNWRSAVRSPGLGIVLGPEVDRALFDDGPAVLVRTLSAVPVGFLAREADGLARVPVGFLTRVADGLTREADGLAAAPFAPAALAVDPVDVAARGVGFLTASAEPVPDALVPRRAAAFCSDVVWAAFDRFVLLARCFACDVELGIVYSVGRVVVGVGDVVVGSAAGSMGGSVGGGGT